MANLIIGGNTYNNIDYVRLKTTDGTTATYFDSARNDRQHPNAGISDENGTVSATKMFLRNYDNMLIAQHMSDVLTRRVASTNVLGMGGTVFGEGAYTSKTTDGVTRDFVFSYADNPYFIMSLSPQGICLGDGNTPVTYEDYRLSGNVVPNNLTQVSSTVEWIVETRKFKKTLVAKYTNSGETDVTISEWGLWRIGSYIASNSVVYRDNSNLSLLLYREVLDEPIVIKAGTLATLTFSIEIPMPNHL